MNGFSDTILIVVHSGVERWKKHKVLLSKTNNNMDTELQIPGVIINTHPNPGQDY